MFGVPLDGPTTIFGDNEAVVKSTTSPESTLKKKHVSVAWHWVREAQAVELKWIQIGKVDTGENLADIFTKVLVGEQWKYVLGHILYWVWPWIMIHVSKLTGTVWINQCDPMWDATVMLWLLWSFSPYDWTNWEWSAGLIISIFACFNNYNEYHCCSNAAVGPQPMHYSRML